MNSCPVYKNLGVIFLRGMVWYRAIQHCDHTGIGTELYTSNECASMRITIYSLYHNPKVGLHKRLSCEHHPLSWLFTLNRNKSGFFFSCGSEVLSFWQWDIKTKICKQRWNRRIVQLFFLIQTEKNASDSASDSEWENKTSRRI